jgi:DNA-binding transcriptional ArsR family regulator
MIIRGRDLPAPAITILTYKRTLILLEAGLVDVEQLGRRRFYRLNAGPLREVFEWSSLYRHLFVDPAGHAWRIAPRARRAHKRRT